jgi:hypothetical protein
MEGDELTMVPSLSEKRTMCELDLEKMCSFSLQGGPGRLVCWRKPQRSSVFRPTFVRVRGQGVALVIDSKGLQGTRCVGSHCIRITARLLLQKYPPSNAVWFVVHRTFPPVLSSSWRMKLKKSLLFA